MKKETRNETNRKQLLDDRCYSAVVALYDATLQC